MSLKLTKTLKKLLQDTLINLKGAARRRFMAQTVLALGLGGQSLAQKELGWNRGTIRKGIKEVQSGIICLDNHSAKGRKKA